MKTLITAASVAVLALTASGPSRGADYPDHPIKIVVAYPPGGSTDVIARTVALRLGERLRQTVLVENRPGAS